MHLRKLIAALAVLMLASAGLSAQDNLFPLRDVHAGLEGVGHTVFSGTKIETFQVEILGVLKNATAPKQDVILARLSGGRVNETGVVEGMSGSPVYVNGKLLGAVALAFPFAKEAYAGITPIEQMLAVVPSAGSSPPEKSAARVRPRIFRVPGDSGEVARLIPDQPAGLEEWKALLGPAGQSGVMEDLQLPLRYGGFSPQAMESFAPLFRRMGLAPMQGPAMAGGGKAEAPAGPEAAAQVVPGSMISVQLVSGDLSLHVDCTVTYRQGNNVYACGHRFMMTGPVEFPFAPANVLATVPSLASSFKLDETGPTVGAIRQDRFGAIYGVVGADPPVIPVHIQLRSTLNRTLDYNFRMVQQGFLSPLLLNLAVASALSSTERIIGPSTVDLKGQIRLSDGKSVKLDDVVSSEANAANLAGVAVSTPLNYLLGSGFENLSVSGIELSLAAHDVERTATLEQAWSTKSEVRPGDKMEVIAVLRTPGGEALVEKIPVEIPASVRGNALSLVVGSGTMMNLLEGRLGPLASPPRDPAQLVRALNRMRHNNRLYALLMAPQASFVMQGDNYPSPPPSLLETFMTDRSTSSGAAFRATSVVGDFETKPSTYSIQGQKTLLLKVVEPGP
jgi:SpoIVB peptidase S55